MSKSSLFSPKKPQPCPQCGAPLVVRQGKHGAFLGCSQYPHCDFHQSLQAKPASQVVKQLSGQHCPRCQAELLLRQGRFGMFICCANWPQCDYSESPDKAEDNALSIACPQCASGQLVTRHSRFGKTFYACNRYPACQFAVNLKPVAGVCAFCQYPLLVEKNSRNGVIRVCASRQCAKPQVEQQATPEQAEPHLEPHLEQHPEQHPKQQSEHDQRHEL